MCKGFVANNRFLYKKGIGMDISGKKILFLGDSITAGACSSDWKEKAYWGVLGTMSGAVVKGYGIGGTRIANQLTKTDAPEDHLHFITRVAQMDDDADIVVVLGGTNDYGTWRRAPRKNDRPYG